MRLERVSKSPAAPNGLPPILFIHGAWHGAWCWDEYFLDDFVARGFEVHALSLRGHGASEGREKLRFTRMRDYVADVASVVDSLPRKPILVGHSMGGFVTQKYLETHVVPGAALLASAPPKGVWRTLLRMTGERPLDVLKTNLTWSLWPIVSDPARARAAFFSADMPEADVARFQAKLQDESYLGFLDFLALDLVDPRKNRSPVFVLGGRDDAIFRPAEVEATARAYGARAHMIDGLAHDVMLEPKWRTVADALETWIRGLGAS